jgi:ferredoxin-like protein FixX
MRKEGKMSANNYEKAHDIMNLSPEDLEENENYVFIGGKPAVLYEEDGENYIMFSGDTPVKVVKCGTENGIEYYDVEKDGGVERLYADVAEEVV